jgi:membrane glycosyltransferase
LIPEEVREPRVLAEARHHAQGFEPLPKLIDAVVDAQTHRHVVRAIPGREPAAGLKAAAQARLIEQVASVGPRALTPAQRQRLMGDAQALQALRAEVLARRAHRQWWMPATPPPRVELHAEVARRGEVVSATR